MPVIMGTAGHIDHGKTSLVRALTGINTDRLKEEQSRGITIELGFAHMDLPEGQRLGIVDVPGHERFVRNMVSGAAGMDFVLLVIAADEGVMPQTREHVEICSLLGLKRGLVALTKTDMVDEELQALAEEDVRGFLKGTFLEQADVVPVSAVSGAGMTELRHKIADLALKDTPQRRADLFRLPVDRVFTIKGHGTVVTGTLLSGSPKVGDEVAIMPGNVPSRVRSLQNHGQSEDTASPGQRLSLNLAAVDVEGVNRGDVVAWQGTLEPSRRWLVSLMCLSSAPRALRQRAEVHFHHGTREVSARMYYYEGDRLHPGETGLAEVHFSEAMVGVYGDRFVVRAGSPLRTVAGGWVVNPLDTARKRKLFTPETRSTLLGLPGKSDTEVLSAQLGLKPMLGQRQLALCSNLDDKRLEKALNLLSGQGQASCFDKEARMWISAAGLAEMQEKFLERAKAFHKKDPLRPGMAKGVLQSGWPNPRLAHFVLEKLLKAGKLEADGDVVRLAGHKVSLASDQSMLKEALLKAHADAAFSPPNLKDVLEGLNVSQKEADPVLKILQAEKSLIKIREGLYYHAPALGELMERVKSWFDSHDDLDPASLKELSGGLSRKYIIPLLEYFDKERLTIRVGDKRQWRGR